MKRYRCALVVGLVLSLNMLPGLPTAEADFYSYLCGHLRGVPDVNGDGWEDVVDDTSGETIWMSGPGRLKTLEADLDGDELSDFLRWRPAESDGPVCYIAVSGADGSQLWEEEIQGDSVGDAVAARLRGPAADILVHRSARSGQDGSLLWSR